MLFGSVREVGQRHSREMWRDFSTTILGTVAVAFSHETLDPRKSIIQHQCPFVYRPLLAAGGEPPSIPPCAPRSAAVMV